MLACAAIQKLERYGQLGWKRSSSEDFVLSSLKDSKRTNIYALTHFETWRECLAAFQPKLALTATGGAGATTTTTTSSSSKLGKGKSQSAASNVNQDDETATSAATYVSAPPRASQVTVSDSLVYAMSFSTALITHHVHAYLQEVAFDKQQQQQQQAHRETGERDALSGTPRASAAAAAVFERGAAGITAAAELLTLLGDIAVVMVKDTRCCRHSYSNQFTQAIAHLLSNVTSLSLFMNSLVMVVNHKSSQKRHDGEKKREEDLYRQSEVAIASMSMSVLSLENATVRQLRRAMAQYPVEMLLHSRTCTAQIKQQINNTKKQTNANAGAGAATMAIKKDEEKDRLLAEMHLDVAAPLAAVLLDCALGGSFTAFDSGLSLFQKMSLLFAILSNPVVAAAAAATATGDDEKAVGSGQGARKTFFQNDHEKHLRGELLNSLCEVLSPIACSRSTRYVVYYRGDDLKLMQCNVKQASEYALHTYVTSPPLEGALYDALLTITQQQPRGDADKHNSCSALRRCVLLLAQWIVSLPYFFQSFCTDLSWTSFAQEQRRAALMRQAKDRRTQRDARKKGKEEKKVAAATTLTMNSLAGSIQERRRSSSSNADSVRSEASSSNVSTTDSVTSRLSDASTAGRGDCGVEGDQRSVITQNSLAHSMLSLESRASLLSTLSKRSAASYLSFLSVLKPEGGAAEGEEEAEPKLHESADGNTNLPLILLEDIVLGLHRFMEVVPDTLLDDWGLRTLCWQTMGQLFSYVESTISVSHVYAAAAAAAGVTSGSSEKTRAIAATRLTPLFNLGQDLRYNHGLGYESLGILFAKVIAPELEKGTIAEEGRAKLSEEAHSAAAAATAALTMVGHKKQGTVTESPASAHGNGVDHTGDARNKRVYAEVALSRCLSAYETVAPQVVDMNLTIILRIASRAASEGCGTNNNTNNNNNNSNNSSNSDSGAVLFNFLANVVERLGKSNQVGMLLDALVAQKDSSSSSSPVSLSTAPAAATVEDTREDVAALQVTFSHPRVRAALVEACAASMDPENLLAHLIKYISAWTDPEGKEECVDEEERDDRRHDPLDVLFVLQLVATVLEGIAPTSVTSSAVLERSTELELLLSSFFVDYLYSPFNGNSKAGEEEYKNDDEEESQKQKKKMSEFFKGGVPRARRLRRLLLQALDAIYRCRGVTEHCLHDLGLQNVEAYLGMLEETLWQVQSQVGQLVVHLSIDELHEAAASPFLSTGEKYRRKELMSHLDARVLLPSLALQRLSLARSVSVILGVSVGPADETRSLVHYVLTALSGGEGEEVEVEGEGCSADRISNANYAALVFANSITEEGWASIMQFAKVKRMRAALVRLLHATFEFSSTVASDEASPLPPPVWLSRCLRCASGTVMRALTDVFVSISSDDVIEYVKYVQKSSKNSSKKHNSAAGEGSNALPVLLDAFGYVYTITGHIPYWPMLLDVTVQWLLALHTVFAAASSNGANAAADDVARRLLGFVRLGITTESRCEDVLRRALITLGNTSHQQQSERKSIGGGSSKGLSRQYVEAIGVPLTLLADLQCCDARKKKQGNATEAGSGEDEEERGESTSAVVVNEMCFEDEIQSLTCALFSDEFLSVLWASSSSSSTMTMEAAAEGGAASTAALPSSEDTAMSIAADLYTTCLSAIQLQWRSDAAARADPLSLRERSPAFCFVQRVAAHFRKVSAIEMSTRRGSSQPLVAFVRGMDKSPLTLPLSAPSSAVTTSTELFDLVEAEWVAVFGHLLHRTLHAMHLSGSNSMSKGNHATPKVAADIVADLDSLNGLHVSLLASFAKKSQNRRASEHRQNNSSRKRGRDVVGTVAAVAKEEGEEKAEEDETATEEHHSAMKAGKVEGGSDTAATMTDLKSQHEHLEKVKRPLAAHVGLMAALLQTSSLSSVIEEIIGQLKILVAPLSTNGVADVNAANSMEKNSRKNIPNSKKQQQQQHKTSSTTEGAEQGSSVHTVAAVVRLLALGEDAGVTAAWTLLSLAEDLHLSTSASRGDNFSTNGGVIADGVVADINAITVTLSRFDPLSFTNDALVAARDVLSSPCAKASNDDTSTPIKRRQQQQPPSVFHASLLPGSRLRPCAATAPFTFLLNALKALPQIMSAHLLHGGGDGSADTHSGKSTVRAAASSGIAASTRGVLPFAFMHATLAEAIPPPHVFHEWMTMNYAKDATTQDATVEKDTDASFTAAAVSVDGSLTRLERGEALLRCAAVTLQQLVAIPGFRFGVLRHHLRRLVCVSGLPCLRRLRQLQQSHQHARVIAGSSSGSRLLGQGPAEDGKNTLWCRVLALCGASSATLLDDDAFVDSVWMFLTTVTAPSHSTASVVMMGTSSAAAMSNASVNVASSSPAVEESEGGEHSQLPLLTQCEVSSVINLLSRTWLGAAAAATTSSSSTRNPSGPQEVLWRRPALVAPTISALFACILRGVRCNVYDSSVLNQMSSFFYQLVKNVEGGRASSTAAPTEQRQGAEEDEGKMATSHASSSSTSKLLKYLCLAAITTNIFELAQHYVSVFTLHSNDLDYIALDFLKTLSRHHLPRSTAPPIAHHKGTKIFSLGMSDNTLSDLTFTCVASADGKALLKQAALRIEEEEGSGNTGDQDGGSGALERRRIFCVD